MSQALAGHLACQVKSCFGQLLSFCAKADPRIDMLTYYTTVKIYSKHEEAPTCVTGSISLLMLEALVDRTRAILHEAQ
jgi:hypothetical protein